MVNASLSDAGAALTLGGRVGVAGSVGVHHTLAEATAAAVGEALERHCLSYQQPDQLVFGSAAELGPAAVDPSRFALFCESQYAAPDFPYVPFTGEHQTAWLEGFRIRDRAEALIPAELVWFVED